MYEQETACLNFVTKSYDFILDASSFQITSSLRARELTFKINGLSFILSLNSVVIVAVFASLLKHAI